MSMKSIPYLNPNFIIIIVKLGCEGVNNFSYFCPKQTTLCMLEMPWSAGSKEYPQSMFWSKIKKIMLTIVNPIFTL